MLREVNINFDVLEMMLFYWESVASKDKITDEYFIEIANKVEVKPLYNEEFSLDSFRRVLSSISNREKLNNKTSLESKFWSQNMRMIEDLNLTRAMLAPIKILNLDTLKSEPLELEKLSVVFIPFPEGDYIVESNTIYFNFFSIIASYKDIENPSEISVLLHGKSVKEYVIECVKKAYKK